MLATSACGCCPPPLSQSTSDHLLSESIINSCGGEEHPLQGARARGHTVQRCRSDSNARKSRLSIPESLVVERSKTRTRCNLGVPGSCEYARARARNRHHPPHNPPRTFTPALAHTFARSPPSPTRTYIYITQSTHIQHTARQSEQGNKISVGERMSRASRLIPSLLRNGSLPLVGLLERNRYFLSFTLIASFAPSSHMNRTFLSLPRIILFMHSSHFLRTLLTPSSPSPLPSRRTALACTMMMSTGGASCGRGGSGWDAATWWSFCIEGMMRTVRSA